MTSERLRAIVKEWWLPATVALLAAVLVIPLLLGCRSYVILSGSMEPRYPVGSMVYIHSTKAEALQAGDVISFEGAGGTPVTHRVLSVSTAEQSLQTKGDANESPDPVPVAFEQVLGKAVFCLPFVGYLSLLLWSRTGIVLLSVAVGVAGALWVWRKFGVEPQEEESE